MRNRNRLAFCAVLAALNVGATEIQLLPAGEFRGIDGRPAEVHSWRVTAEIAERLRATLAARVNPLPVDYEHQTLRSVENGQPAPAAGWLKAVEWRDGLGLFGVVEWTERARALIAAGEYRYISPVFRYDAATGEPLELLPPALVNYPAIDGMQAVALSALAEAWSGSPSQQEITTMNELLKAVLKALGLKDDATPEAATAAFAALNARLAAAPKALGLQDDAPAEAVTAAIAALAARAAAAPKALGLQDDAPADAVCTAIAALKAGGPDPAKFVSVDVVNSLRDQVAALSAVASAREVDETVKAALADGRILPPMEAWARELGKKDIAALKAYVAAATPIAALGGTQTRGKQPGAGGDGKLTDVQIAVCKAIGVSEEDYAASLKATTDTAAA